MEKLGHLFRFQEYQCFRNLNEIKLITNLKRYSKVQIFWIKKYRIFRENIKQDYNWWDYYEEKYTFRTTDIHLKRKWKKQKTYDEKKDDSGDRKTRTFNSNMIWDTVKDLFKIGKIDLRNNF